jgi:hypothetical protein
MKASIREAILLLHLLLLDGRIVGGDVVVVVDVKYDAPLGAAGGGHHGPRSSRRRPDPPRDFVDVDSVSASPPSSRTLQEGAGVDDVHALTDRLGDVYLLGSETQHHLASDVFEGDIVVTYEDVAINYGTDLADRLGDGGFVYANDTSSIEGDGGVISRGERLDRGRKLGLTSESYRTWNLPEYRRSDGKLQIPYAINQTSSHLQGETTDTIHQALATIEKSTGIIAFVPRANEASYIFFEYMPNACAANLGRGNPSTVYLGWCRFKEHRGEMIHEILHALGFWHEQSRPDRDMHVTVLTSNILSYAMNNFGKQNSSFVNSLGSPYDYGSIMHYPPWAFQKSSGLSTIVPTRALEKWEVMGQCGRMSSSDVQQLRAMYQCTAGSRNLASITVDNMCTNGCKCWAFAPGMCNTDDDCMGDLICGSTPAIIPKGEEYLDQLPPHISSDVPTSTSCLTSCHANCCHLGHNIVMCPETCDTAPPVVDQGPMPRKMCLPRPEPPTMSPSPTKTPTNRPTRGVRYMILLPSYRISFFLLFRPLILNCSRCSPRPPDRRLR